MQFSEEIKDFQDDLIFVADKVIEHFYPEVQDNEALYVEEFSRALNNNPKKLFLYRISLNKLNKAGEFIDADTFAHEKDYESLLKLITKSWVPFKKVDVSKISVADGNIIMSAFLKEQSRLSDRFNICIINQLRLTLHL
jgi:hypothetical protein